MAVNVAPGATALRPVSCIWPAVPVHWTGPEYVPDGARHQVHHRSNWCNPATWIRCYSGFRFPVDLFTGVVAPTICSLLGNAPGPQAGSLGRF